MFGFKRNAEKQPSKIGGMFGFVIFLGAAAVLAWNESRTVNVANAIGELERNLQRPAAAQVDTQLDGKPIYLQGLLETDRGVADQEFEFGDDKILILRRSVEMYQWKSRKRDKRTVWEQEWSDDEESGSGDHENPPFPIQEASFAAEDAHLGAYKVSPDLVARTEHEDQYFIPTVLPQARIDEGYEIVEEWVFRGKGSPSDPQIGDVRIAFEVFEEGPASMIGTQRGSNLEIFVAKNGTDVAILKQGEVSAEQLITDEKSGNKTLGNILLGVGGGGMALGLGMGFAGFVSWLAWIPLLGPLIQRAAFWTGALLGGVLALVLFIGAWLWAHPLIFIGLLALGSMAAIAMGVLKRKQVQPSMAAGPPPMSMPQAGYAPPPPPPPGFGPPPV